MSFLIEFTETEREIFETHRVIFTNNERNYLVQANDEGYILDSGQPTFFTCSSFKWNGMFWKNLLIQFTNWFIDQSNYDYEKLLMIRFDSNGKTIFSRTKASNHYGPLTNGLYINGNPTSGNLVWRKILQLIKILNSDFLKDTYVYIHYPSAVEPREIFKIIWKKEIGLYAIYLEKLGYDSKYINENIKFIKYINSVYKKMRRNYYFFIVDRLSDLANGTTLIKKALTPSESKKLLPVLTNINNFKRLIRYPDSISTKEHEIISSNIK